LQVAGVVLAVLLCLRLAYNLAAAVVPVGCCNLMDIFQQELTLSLSEVAVAEVR
jgi:hypothetical protein